MRPEGEGVHGGTNQCRARTVVTCSTGRNWLPRSSEQRAGLPSRRSGRDGDQVWHGCASLWMRRRSEQPYGPGVCRPFPHRFRARIGQPRCDQPEDLPLSVAEVGQLVGHQPAVVARVGGISRQAVYRRPSRRPWAAGPGRAGPDDQVIVEVARANPTDGTRMVAALASRELGRPVNRKRVQRVMRAHRLLQPSRSDGRRRRPGFFRVARPDALWHLDMTKVWTPRKATACRHRR